MFNLAKQNTRRRTAYVWEHIKLENFIKIDQLKIVSNLDSVVRGTVENTPNSLLDTEANSLMPSKGDMSV